MTTTTRKLADIMLASHSNDLSTAGRPACRSFSEDWPVNHSHCEGGPACRSFSVGWFTNIMVYCAIVNMEESQILVFENLDAIYAALYNETTSLIYRGSTFEDTHKIIFGGGNFALLEVIDNKLLIDSFNCLLFIVRLILILKISNIYTLNNKLNNSTHEK